MVDSRSFLSRFEKLGLCWKACRRLNLLDLTVKLDNVRLVTMMTMCWRLNWENCHLWVATGLLIHVKTWLR